MEGNIEKDCTALGALFQHIINDLRSSSPVWEDFTAKATKLHTTLRTTLVAISTFLEAFQKVADMATNTRGATKDIGLALTRLCLRHRSIEGKLKSFTGSITDGMVAPIQDKLEEWKKTVAQIDKDHNKECKKARAEIKKAASDTVRLQKKVKKGSTIPMSSGRDMQSKLDHALHDVHGKFKELEEAEKSAVRKVLIEERSRFCLFVTSVKPFVEGEINLLTEVTHLQEIMDSLVKHSSYPERLPQASEQVLVDLKGADLSTWSLHDNIKHSPPSSPSSMGSRKSSMCSMSSLNSSSSGSSKSHSPSHHFRQRSASQPMPVGAVRLTSVSSQDSGFTSQDTIFHRPSLHLLHQQSNNIEASSTGESTPTDSTPSTPSEQASTPSASSTWNNWPEQPKTGSGQDAARPHTISTAYERSHARPALSATMFEPPVPEIPEKEGPAHMRIHPSSSSRPHSSSHYARPANISKLQAISLPGLGPKPKPVAPPVVPTLEADELPVYVNMNELVTMEAEKRSQAGRDDSGDSEGQQTPVTPQDPGALTVPQPGQAPQCPGALDIQEAIRSLESCTAALHSDYESIPSPVLATEPPPESTKTLPPQKLQNSLELAEAIRELEASTAALTTAYDQSDGSNASRGSLQCSSGYGTMNSTPSGSEDTITTGELIETPIDMLCPDREKYFTIPRNSEFLRAYKATIDARRPNSTAGIPVTQVGITSLKKNGKPPPPVRRSSSVSGGPPPVLQKNRRSPPKGPPANARIVLDGQHNMLHRRSNSTGGEAQPTIIIKHTRSSDTLLDNHNLYATPQLQSQAELTQPPSPQYAVPHLVLSQEPSIPAEQGDPNYPGTSGIVQSLNAKFAAFQAQQQQQHIQNQEQQQHFQNQEQQQHFQNQEQQQQQIQQQHIQNQVQQQQQIQIQQQQQQQVPPQTKPKPQSQYARQENGDEQLNQQHLNSQPSNINNHNPIYAELSTPRVSSLHPHHEVAEEDFPDLPPPPTEEELAELNAQFSKRPVNSTMTELKQGPQLRKTGAIEKTQPYQI